MNLAAKSILRQFEIPKKKKTNESDGNGNGNNDGRLCKAIDELMALSNEIEDEPTMNEVDDNNDGNLEDNEEGLEDECQALSADEITQFEVDLIPVRLMLTKV